MPQKHVPAGGPAPGHRKVFAFLRAAAGCNAPRAYRSRQVRILKRVADRRMIVIYVIWVGLAGSWVNPATKRAFEPFVLHSVPAAGGCARGCGIFNRIYRRRERERYERCQTRCCGTNDNENLWS